MGTERREREAHRAFCQFRDTGDPDAITRVYDLVAGRLLALARRLAGDRAGADDLVQSTFLDAIERAGRFDPARPLVPWLTGILVHHAQHGHRHAQRVFDAARLDQPRGESSPASDAEAREFAEFVAAALERLPARYRDVVRMRLLEGLEPAAIAQLLGRPRETVKTQFARGIARLRRTPAAVRATPAPSTAPTRWIVTSRPLRRLAITVGCASGLGLVALGFRESSEQDVAPDAAADTIAAVDPRTEAADPAMPQTTLVRRDLDPLPGAPLAIRVRRQRDGSAVAGIEVAVRPAADESWQRERRAITDADGTARLPRALLLGEGPWQARTSHGERPRRIDTTDGGVDLEIPPGITVKGRVLDATGAPIAGARLWAAPCEPIDDGGVVGRTGADGTFLIADLPPGAGLGALASGWGAPAAVLLGDADRDDLVFQCLERAAPIHGTVRDPDGRPVSGAAVQIGATRPPGLLPVGVPSRAFTDVDGRFVCDDQRDGQIRVFVGAPGFAATMTGVRRHPRAGERRLDVRLSRGATLGGRVTRANGAPLAGARIEVRQAAIEPPDGYELDGPRWVRVVGITDARGHYRVTDLGAGASSLRCRAADGARAAADCTILEGGDAQQDFTLGRGTTLVGDLVDPDGTPLADWRISPWIDGNERLGPPVRSDASGRFVVPACEEGHPYRLFVQQDRAPGWIRCVLHGPDGPPERVLFDLLRTTAEGVIFHARCEANGTHGHFRIGPLLAGKHTLVASTATFGTLPLGVAEVQAGAEVDGGAHSFLTPATLTVRLAGTDGRPAAIGDLTLVRDGLDGGLALPLAGGVGRRELQPGIWHACYLGTAGSPLYERIELEAGAHVERVLSLVPGVSRTFRLVPTPPEHVPLRFDWFDGNGVCVFVETRVIAAADDRTWRACLTPSSYRVVVRDSVGREAVTEFDVDRRATSAEIVEIRLPTGR